MLNFISNTLTLYGKGGTAIMCEKGPTILLSVGAPSTISIPPLLLRIGHRFKEEDSNIGRDGARGASRHVFVYLICVWCL